jgi:hypothetical protein
MLNAMRKTEAPPFAGDLQRAVDRLCAILTPIDLAGSSHEAACFELKESLAARDVASAECDALCRKHGARAGHTDAPPVAIARQSLTRAIDRCVAARIQVDRTKQKRDEAFLRDAVPQMSEAAPIFLECVRLMNDAMAPLASLYGFALRNQLPMPRLLAVALPMREAVRAMTACVNHATEPSQSSETENL